ncbi:D-aminoacyl-tRNA deacylase [uncultured Negativibacillus sp.]|uniref:D-aminoacyl-tRNA deacylase n=1 Tax=uncultured Negativibacillus sp. TaxID=1980696 RepID=UPI0025DDC52C|nr:D-aminoacyl-tRNA deacylase [uncultured Negativibacillus sp.]
MRALVQRVTHASVTVEGDCVGKISEGLLVLLGVGPNDTEKEADFLAKKCANLRIFTDENDKMNLSLLDIGGQMLVVSQFTLYADCSHGRRPAFIGAAAPELANRLYEYFQQSVQKEGVQTVQHGIFGADMKVELLNNGPVTILLDTDEIMPKK